MRWKEKRQTECRTMGLEWVLHPRWVRPSWTSLWHLLHHWRNQVETRIDVGVLDKDGNVLVKRTTHCTIRIGTLRMKSGCCDCVRSFCLVRSVYDDFKILRVVSDNWNVQVRCGIAKPMQYSAVRAAFHHYVLIVKSTPCAFVLLVCLRFLLTVSET
jgi:hypothetical protein